MESKKEFVIHVIKWLQQDYSKMKEDLFMRPVNLRLATPEIVKETIGDIAFELRADIEDGSGNKFEFCISHDCAEMIGIDEKTMIQDAHNNFRFKLKNMKENLLIRMKRCRIYRKNVRMTCMS